MDLILWRHAEAELLRLGQDDMERGLTPKGERQARRMAAWLDERLPQSTRVLASPALRTQQTARALGRRFKSVDLLAPGRSVDDLLTAAHWPDSGEPVLIVGHQPTLGLAAARLLAGAEQAWTVKKGAVWWLVQRDRFGVAQVALQAVQGPEKA
jgi:phosphohistidine phosphatase